MENINFFSFILVFFWGSLSFFSPCIIPLIPIYMGYLAGDKKHGKKEIIINTLFFSFGISSAFFTLGMSFTMIGDFLFNNRMLLSKIGGVIIILLGLFQLGILKSSFLEREKRIDFSTKGMNPIIAFVTGFTFSFAWTPCVGPMLTSLVIMTSSLDNRFVGNILLIFYSLGFTLPFIFLALFTDSLLNLLKRKRNLLKYTTKLGGVLLIAIGVLTFSGKMLEITKYFGTEQISSQESKIKDENIENGVIVDQFGNEQNLLMYKDKVVFLNFWASWCPPCKEEMPYIEELYKEYGENKEDVVFLGMVNPSSKRNPYGQDKSKEEIVDFIKRNGYTFPSAFDETGEILNMFRIKAFPTTFIIGKDGKIKEYIPGAISKETMKILIEKHR